MGAHRSRVPVILQAEPVHGMILTRALTGGADPYGKSGDPCRGSGALADATGETAAEDLVSVYLRG